MIEQEQATQNTQTTDSPMPLAERLKMAYGQNVPDDVRSFFEWDIPPMTSEKRKELYNESPIRRDIRNRIQAHYRSIEKAKPGLDELEGRLEGLTMQHLALESDLSRPQLDYAASGLQMGGKIVAKVGLERMVKDFGEAVQRARAGIAESRRQMKNLEVLELYAFVIAGGSDGSERLAHLLCLERVEDLIPQSYRERLESARIREEHAEAQQIERQRQMQKSQRIEREAAQMAAAEKIRADWDLFEGQTAEAARKAAAMATLIDAMNFDQLLAFAYQDIPAYGGGYLEPGREVKLIERGIIGERQYSAALNELRTIRGQSQKPGHQHAVDRLIETASESRQRALNQPYPTSAA